MTPDIDWDSIKAQYITGTMGYRKLATDWGVSNRTLGDRGKREEWPRLRQEYRDKKVAETVRKVEARSSAKTADHLLNLRESAEKMSEVIVRIFDDAEQFYRHIVAEGHDSTFGSEEKLFRKADTKAIKDLTGAMKDLAAVIRNVNDLPTVQEAQAMKLAADKFGLEKKKIEADEEFRNKGLTVVFKPMDGSEPPPEPVNTEEWSE